MGVIIVQPWAPFWSKDLRDAGAAAFAATNGERTPEAGMSVQAAIGRSCDGCTLCCKLVAVESLAKPQGHWCDHCDPRNGCAIYTERPNQCRGFFCAWALGQGAPEMKPNASHCVFDFDAVMPAMRVHVDPLYPNAWRVGLVADHIRLLHAMNCMVVVLIQNKQRPCPAFGIPGVHQGDGLILDPQTNQPWCEITKENLP